MRRGVLTPFEQPLIGVHSGWARCFKRARRAPERWPERRPECQERVIAVMFEFVNEALTDFSHGTEREKMKQALNHVKGQLGKYYDLIIDGQHVAAQGKIVAGHAAWHQVNQCQCR